MPANILNLVAYAVTAITQNEHDYHIATEVKDPPTVCALCRSDQIVGFGVAEMTYQHIQKSEGSGIWGSINRRLRIPIIVSAETIDA